MSNSSENFVSTRNPCKACTPLGASMVFSGVEGAIPLLHGSQGCSTYIRRYLIGHFREPMDIASSNFHEKSAVFGGQQNLTQAVDNVVRQYSPEVIGISTTCLAETIGDDVPMFLHEIKRDANGPLPYLIPVSTPSYQGSHTDGFHATVLSLIKHLSDESECLHNGVNLMPGMISPADIRHLKQIMTDFGLDATILPDYSDTLDGPAWESYHRIPDGGTPVQSIKKMCGSRASFEFTSTIPADRRPGAYLNERFGVADYVSPLPMSVKLTDRFFANLEDVSGRESPDVYAEQRGRLLDAYVDGHKYVFGKKAVVYGEEDLVVGLTAFLCEIGITPVLCATGGTCKNFDSVVREHAPELPKSCIVSADTDFKTMEAMVEGMAVDILIGNSNGYKIARALDVPLIRVGLPIHDRIGAARIQTLAYRGIQQLYDRIVNAFIQRQQDESPVGYTHI